MKLTIAISILSLLVLDRGLSSECKRNWTTTDERDLERWFLQNSNQSSKTFYTSTSTSSVRPQELVSRAEADDHQPLDLVVQRDMYTDDQMQLIYNYFYDIGAYHGKVTISDVGFIALTTRSHSLIYDDMLMHRYDNYAATRQSFGPQINQERCLSQLKQLVKRAELATEQEQNSTDWEVLRLLDQYGRPPAGLFVANVLWLGLYEECQSSRFDTVEGGSQGRYCLASLKHKDWPKENELSKVMAYKAGVCLPKACDSFPYKSKFDLIQKLIDFNTRRVDRDRLKLDSLYCVPDEDSPARMWWRSPRTLQATAVLTAWIALLVYATIKYESYLKLLSELPAADVHGTGKNFLLDVANSQRVKIFRMLSITNNFKMLMNTSGRKIVDPGEAASRSRSNSGRSRSGSNTSTSGSASAFGLSPAIINLRCLEGIKVIFMSFIIMGHVLMAIPNIMSNGRDLAGTSSPLFIVSNLMPAFAVNAFFSITGMLTCYLLLKQNESHSFITNPIKWLIIICYRYLRIMPVYAVVVFFCKHISKFTGSGPMWDYGTSSLAHRGRCEQESWLWTLLFGANFKSPFQHCIPSAWYLANDFQFLLVTPIFMLALYKSPALGQKLIGLCTGAGILAGLVSMNSAEGEVRPVANFMPHGFKTYVTFLSDSYTRPQYRIPAYLVGLLLGYHLYRYEQSKLKHRAATVAALYQDRSETTQTPEAPEWPAFFTKHGARLSLLSLVLYAIIPLGPAKITAGNGVTKFMLALTMPTYHVVFSLGVGLYILLAATDHGNKSLNGFLSASIWKPLARLNLCIVLVNIEVVNYIMQSHRQHVHVDFLSQTAIYLLCLVATYLAATVVYVLFEAPMKASLNHLVSSLISMLKVKRKID